MGPAGPYTFDNGDTRKELLARSRYVLYKSPEKWTLSQRERAEIMFREYPDIERAYQLAQHLRTVFNKRSQKSAARLNLARWYDQGKELQGFPKRRVRRSLLPLQTSENLCLKHRLLRVSRFYECTKGTSLTDW